jgi:hypothetical protein
MFGLKFDTDEYKKDVKNLGNDCKVAGLALLEMAGKTLTHVGETLTKKAKGNSKSKE